MNREYKISLSQEYYSDTVYLSQYDTNYPVTFHVVGKYASANEIDGLAAKFTGTRNDGLGFTFDSVASGAIVPFVINTSLTAVSGMHTGEIVFTDANGLYYGSANVQIIVEPAARPDGTIDADTERAQEIAEQIQEIVDNAAAEVKGEAESWAVGQRDGTDVPATDPTYHNNAKYYAAQAKQTADSIGIDATLTQAGKAADAKATGDAVSELKSEFTAKVDKDGVAEVTEKNTTFFYASPNLIDLSTVVDGYRINQKGTDVYEDNGRSTTGYINVKDISEVVPFYFPSGVKTATTIYYVLYNASKTPLADRASTNQAINTSSATYIRVSFDTSKKDTIMLFDSSKTVNAYAPFGYKFDYNNALEQADSDIESRQIAKLGNVNATNPSNISYEKAEGCYFTSEVGKYAVFSTSSSYYFVAFRAFDINKLYTITLREHKGSGPAYIVACDKTGLCLKTWGTTPESNVTLSFDVEIPLHTDVLYISSYDQSASTNYITIVEKDFVPLQNQIDDIRGLMQTKYFTPFHQQEDDLVDAVISDRDANTITFGLITDTHYKSDNSARQTEKMGDALCGLCERVGAKFAVHLGDVIEGGRTTHDLNFSDLLTYWKPTVKHFIPLLYTLAHHEQYGVLGANSFGNDATACTKDECIGVFGRKDNGLNPVYNGDYNSNWYVDIDGVRFIGLDCTTDTSPMTFSSGAIAFLGDALNTNKKVVIMAHATVEKYLNVYNGSAGNSADVLSLLTAHTAGVLAFFHGHTHWDNIYNYGTDTISAEGVGGNWPNIATNCAMASKTDLDTYGCRDGDPTVYDRVVGEYSEYCFDIVNLHKNGTIKMFRFGCGNDRTYTPS